jgi:hypothetical protein
MWRILTLSALTVASPAAAQTVVKADRQWTSEGQYMAFASPWCANYDKTLVAGRHYGNAIVYRAGDLAAGKSVQLRWQWPAPEKRPKKCGVFGYNHVAWGNYDSGAVMSPVAPRRVSDLTELTFTYQTGHAAEPNSFNGLTEFYLTREPGKAETKAVEIGWFWHAPPETQAWAKTGRQFGTFTDRFGHAWTVAASQSGAAGLYVTLTPPEGKLYQATIDAKATLDFLRAAGVVKAGWWFNGAAIGVEPLGGKGSAVVHTFAVAVN